MPLLVPYGPAPAQFGNLWVPPRGTGPFAVLVTLHGGYWRARYGLEEIESLARAIADVGIAVWNVEYRRLGMPGGDMRGMLHDARAGVAFVRSLAMRYPLVAAPPVVLGHSAGGHLALCLAKDEPVRGVVALAPVSNLRLGQSLRLNHGVVDELFESDDSANFYDLGSPIERVPIGAPQILVHGTEDEEIPLAMSESYVARARAAGDDVRLEALPGVDHFAPVDPASPAFPVVLRAVQELLTRWPENGT